VIHDTNIEAIHGRQTGVTIDNRQFFDGGEAIAAFVDITNNDFWPAPGSLLHEHTDRTLAPEWDFNETKRAAPSDVGTYESHKRERNPGWPIQAEFKRSR